MNVLSFINQKKPSNLSHYTNFEALISIIKNEELWLSNLWFLNDRNEYKEGLSIIETKYLEKIKKHKEPNIKILLNTLESAISLLKQQSVYVISLTTNEDLLSQWRGYGGNNGVGIKFNFSNNKTINLFPCIYNKKMQEEYINHIFENTIEIFNKTKENGLFPKEWCNEKDELPYWDAINIAGSNFISKCNVACALIKNEGFKEEEEWRLLNFSSENINFLSKGSFIKPFIKMKILNFKETLTGVIIGPNPDEDLCKRSIVQLLKSKKIAENQTLFDTLKITSSSIPFRC